MFVLRTLASGRLRQAADAVNPRTIIGKGRGAAGAAEEHSGGEPPCPMDLATTYLGLKLRSPLIVGASPLCDDADSARRLQDAGAGAVVLRSLFAEQVPAPGLAEVASGMHQFQEFADYQQAASPYLRQVGMLKQHLSIPVIASL